MIVDGLVEVVATYPRTSSIYHQTGDEPKDGLDLISHSIDMVLLLNEFNYGLKMALLLRQVLKKMSKRY